MKKYLFLLPLLAFVAPAVAQHTELSGQVQLGLMRFGGADATGTTAVNYSCGRGYTNSPYGSQVGPGFSLGLQAQRVGQKNTLLAFAMAYDQMRSRISIGGLNLYDGTSNTLRPATGHTYLQTRAIAAALTLGHRFALGSGSLDVLAGPELAFVFGLHETGSGTYDGNQSWTTDVDRSGQLIIDPRLRAGLTYWCHRVGISSSYSHGFANYQAGLLGASPQVASRTWRLGLAYRLR